MDTVEELNGTYFFDGMIGLSAGELAFWIIVDEAQKELGTQDVVALALLIGGYPFIPVTGKLDVRRATAGTSPLSYAARHMIRYKMKKPLKTLTWENMLRGKWSPTRSLGAFVGRWVPWIGVVITMYDLWTISSRSLRRYNLIAKKGDRL
ncbi:STM2901 family protein [Serratia plymuthica]|uniref:Uncharacterized protein n=1 Tax=Serratia plymuthica TaxID=82996 RepID=A0A7T2WDT4_SERPL|nr:hypothetical protein [Serratia plymuthica]QPS22100.1 hypothetical protein I6G64_06830 [Serratia plymuthica]QPS63711.1 hypothetical protein I6G52_02620 [Serratia plymuthica]